MKSGNADGAKGRRSEKTEQRYMTRHRADLIMTTKLVRFTQWARESPQRQYNALMGLLFDPDGLSASFERQAGRKAPGVDGIRKADYAEGLEDRLLDLSARLRRLGYRPKPVRRVYIPKGRDRK